MASAREYGKRAFKLLLLPHKSHTIFIQQIQQRLLKSQNKRKSTESDRKMEENDKKTVQKTPLVGVSMFPAQNLRPPPPTKS
jgi:hypothetical protein